MYACIYIHIFIFVHRVHFPCKAFIQDEYVGIFWLYVCFYVVGVIHFLFDTQLVRVRSNAVEGVLAFRRQVVRNLAGVIGAWCP